MTDPERWLDSDDAPEHWHRLAPRLPAARPLPPEVKARARRRITRLAAVPVATAISWFTLKAAATVAVTAATTVGTIVAVQAWLPSTTPAEAIPQSVAETPGPPPKAAPLAHPTPSAVAEEDAGTHPDAGTLASAASTSSSRGEVLVPKRPLSPTQQQSAPSNESARPPALSPLELELALVERARSLVDPAPAQALVAVQSYRTEFPNGQLAFEAAFVEIKALKALGRKAAAEGLARRLLQSAPRGLYRQRIQELLGIEAKQDPLTRPKDEAPTDHSPRGTNILEDER